MRWISAMQLQRSPANNGRLCSLHFEDEDFSSFAAGCPRLKRDAVPSLFPRRLKRKQNKLTLKKVSSLTVKRCAIASPNVTLSRFTPTAPSTSLRHSEPQDNLTPRGILREKESDAAPCSTPQGTPELPRFLLTYEHNCYTALSSRTIMKETSKLRVVLQEEDLRHPSAPLKRK